MARMMPLWGLGVAVAVAFAGFGAGCGAGEPVAREGAWKHVPEKKEHTPHYTFFNAPFPDGPSVTRACLACHEDASHEVMKTAHWRWEGEEAVVPGHDKAVRIGKKNTINNFCIGIRSNWASCTTCHVGYGWEDESFDFENPELVDCLGCHDGSGTYAKKPKGAGVPDPNVDLLAVARSVGRPGRANCGSCHFNGGGGNAVKHGDLDMSMVNPEERIDVHMGRHELSCVDCHQTEKHNVPGRAMSLGSHLTNRVACTDCHEGKIHEDPRLQLHTEKVACQACHIPAMAVEEATKMTWDWSEAGQDLDINDPHVYLKIKGRFTYDKEVAPEYAWYNGTSTHYLIGDTMDPATTTRIAGPLGTREDPQAKLWPFKVHRGKQPYDKVHKTFLVPHTAGPGGYWTTFDWPSALKEGAAANGQAFSGEYGFAPTEMFWPLSHMVAPKERALSCRDCHGPSGRLDWKALGYPGDPLGTEPFEHDAVELQDADGTAVTESGKPLSLKTTCSACHDLNDADFAANHGYHRGLKDMPLDPARASLLPNGPEPAPAVGESDCLLCHLAGANEDARRAALAAGKTDWALSATLLGTGLVGRTEDGYAWISEKFDGTEAKLALGRPTEENCGACHGRVHNGAAPLTLNLGADRDWVTEMTGQVFSSQKVRNSGLNLKDKDTLRRSWDIHAERLVTCAECHYAKDVPQRFADAAKPDAGHADGTRRSCESCHSVDKSHTWLDFKDEHLAALSCEACHIPRLYAPARATVDHTTLDADARPTLVYRGLELADGEAFLTGYAPALLPRRDGGKLAPFNLVTTFRWVAADGQPVSDATLRAAWRDGDAVRPMILAGLDTNQDGQLSPAELRLDAPIKVAAVRAALALQGVKDPHIVGTVDALPIHHNVGLGQWATRACDACHTTKTAKTLLPAASVTLAPFLPGAVTPTLRDRGEGRLEGALTTAGDGGLSFTPSLPATAPKSAPAQGAK